MKKAILTSILTIFAVTLMTDHALAMGWRKNRNMSHNSGSSSVTGSSTTTSTTSSTSSSEEDFSSQGGTAPYVPTTPTNTPAAVPEPVSLSLMGAGLAALYLRKRMRQ
jgi:hypothetical protein